MIRYALVCDRDHAFEAWFRDSDTYQVQRDRGLVTCAVCGSSTIDKQIMAPSVARTDRDRPARIEAPEEAMGSPEPAAAAPQPVALMDPRAQAFRDLLRAVRQHVMSNAEHVGPRFAEEARKMHDGLSEFRAIWGEATPAEAQALAEEGIDAMMLPGLPDEHN